MSLGALNCYRSAAPSHPSIAPEPTSFGAYFLFSKPQSGGMFMLHSIQSITFRAKRDVRRLASL